MVRLLIPKPVTVLDLKEFLRCVWQPREEIEVFEIGEAKYIIQFSNSVDCLKALTQQPWNFRRSLLALK